MRYAFWLLFRYKFVIGALIAYAAAFMVAPDFALFSVIILPIVVLTANAILSFQILTKNGEARFMTTRQAIEISVSAVAMAILGVILNGRALLAVIPIDMDVGEAIAVIYSAVIVGIILGVCEIILPEIIKMFSGDR